MTFEDLDYGYELIGSLRKDLRSLQGFSTVVHELIQNAEDAGASRFWMDFTEDALWVGNDATFSEKNFKDISSVGSASKRYENDQIGSFGVGFVSVYQITDQPEISSGNIRQILYPLTRKAQKETTVEPPRWPSTFRLPWALEQTELREKLESEPLTREKIADYKIQALEALCDSGIFLRNLKELTLLIDGEIVEHVKLIREEGKQSLLHVKTRSGQISYRIYKVSLGKNSLDYLRKNSVQRRDTLTLARPIEVSENFCGRLFAFLPTQEKTFLPFHINADFYPNTDRKGLLWEGDHKLEWNINLLNDIANEIPYILEDIANTQGADELYGFTEHIFRAGEKIGSSGNEISKFVKQSWKNCIRAFESKKLYFLRGGGRAGRTEFIFSHRALSFSVVKKIEQVTNWRFPPESHFNRKSLFDKLRANSLSPKNYLYVIKRIFDVPIEDKYNALEILEPFFQELNHAFKIQPDLLEDKKEASEVLNLYLGVAEDGSNQRLSEFWRIPVGFNRVDFPWLLSRKIPSTQCINLLPIQISDRIEEYTPEKAYPDLASLHGYQFKIWFERSDWDYQSLYRFLGIGNISTIKIKVLHIFPVQGNGNFEQGTKIVLSTTVSDPFHIKMILNKDAYYGFEKWFKHLGIEPLTEDQYYGELLVEYFKKNVGDRVQYLTKA